MVGGGYYQRKFQELLVRSAVVEGKSPSMARLTEAIWIDVEIQNPTNSARDELGAGIRERTADIENKDVGNLYGKCSSVGT